MKRQDCIPLHEAKEIHAVLTSLAIGNVVPPYIYINDYNNDEIPLWYVREIEQTSIVTALTLVDESIPTYHVAMVVLTAPAKTLGGRHFHYVLGCEKALHMFCDIRQRARVISESMSKGIPPHVVSHNYIKEKQAIVKWKEGESTKNLQKVRHKKKKSLSSIVQVPLFCEGHSYE